MPLRLRTPAGIATLALENWVVASQKLTASIFNQDAGISIDLNYKFPVLKSAENFDEYNVILLKNRFGVKDDNIFSVELPNGPAGWMFPLSLYMKPEYIPNHTENKFKILLRLLFIAFKNLITSDSVLNVPFNFNGETELNISEFYDSETIVWVYWQQDGRLSLDELYRRYLPDLYNWGLIPLQAEGDFKAIFQRARVHQRIHSKAPFSALALRRIATDIEDEEYIRQVFSEVLKRDIGNIARFIVLYQIVELLINKIGLHVYLEKGPFSIDFTIKAYQTKKSESFKNLIDNLKDIRADLDNYTKGISAEDSRVNLLFNKYAPVSSVEHMDFINACKPLSQLTQDALSVQLYSVRNKIVHSYHRLMVTRHNLEVEVEELNYQFESLIVGVLLIFRLNN